MEVKIHRSIKIISIVVLIIAAFFLYLRFVETSGLKVREYRIKNPNIGSYNGLKIVHFSDMHFKTTFKAKDLDELVQKINYINADIIVFTGDVLDSKLNYSNNDIKVLNNFFKQINASIKKYVVKGDADDEESFNRIFQNSDFITLDNNYDLIYFKNNKPLVIAGINASENVSNNLLNAKEYLSKNEHAYSILLTHKPDYIKYADSFDLVLAGHSMNGQIKLPFIGALIKKNGALAYYDEYYKVEKSDLYISGGLGCEGVNLRLLNKPSINFYRIVAK